MPRVTPFQFTALKRPMRKRRERSVRAAIRSEANTWVLRLAEPNDLSEAERTRLHEWLAADPRHLEEFERRIVLGDLAKELPIEIRADLVSDPNSGSLAGVSLRWWALASIAAAVLVVFGLSLHRFVLRYPVRAQSFVTSTAEKRSITLSDGTVADLDAQTSLSWREKSRERIVVLLEGQVFFQVAKNAQRPFVVIVDNSSIRVTGTKFDVYRKPNGKTLVTVAEGAVQIWGADSGAGPGWARELQGGEQLVYGRAGVLGQVHRADPNTATEWRRDHVEFQCDPLPEVVEELSRYTHRKIVIADERVNQAQVGGRYSTRDVGKALRQISNFLPIIVRETPPTDHTRGTYTLEYRLGDSKDAVRPNK